MNATFFSEKLSSKDPFEHVESSFDSHAGNFLPESNFLCSVSSGVWKKLKFCWKKNSAKDSFGHEERSFVIFNQLFRQKTDKLLLIVPNH